jgi:hypothetical protein
MPEFSDRSFGRSLFSCLGDDVDQIAAIGASMRNGAGSGLSTVR